MKNDTFPATFTRLHEKLKTIEDDMRVPETTFLKKLHFLHGPVSHFETQVGSIIKKGFYWPFPNFDLYYSIKKLQI